ncbi:MAG: hypothetical protein NVS4B12_28310 [Ktedonobacteraceae bacterium]
MTEEYAQIQTYATCNERTYAIVASHYRLVLEQLGCTDTQVLSWLDTVHWPTSDNDGLGDIYAAPFTLTPGQEEAFNETIECAGIEISLYIDTAIPSTEELPSWVAFNLLFDANILREGSSAPYSAKIGPLLWRILQKQAGAFRELGAYFTDEWQENQPWRALAAQLGNPWDFDLAIFPRSKAEYFTEVPAGFKGTVTPQGFGFAQTNRWLHLPWEQV